MFKISCYVQNQKLWASITHNHDLFEKTGIWVSLLADQMTLKIFFLHVFFNKNFFLPKPEFSKHNAKN